MSLIPIIELIEQYRGYMNDLGKTSSALCAEEIIYISQRLDDLLNVYHTLHKENKIKSCA